MEIFLNYAMCIGCIPVLTLKSTIKYQEKLPVPGELWILKLSMSSANKKLQL